MTITLPVTMRDKATTAKTLLANGSLPAVVYGPKQEPIPVTLDAKVFDKIRHDAGESTIVELTGLKETIEVLIKDLDFNPVKQQVMHVDFYAIERGKEMTTHITLNFVGDAPVEKSGAGSVTKVLQEVTVTCRPSSLPSHIDVDVSSLVNVEDKIFVNDLKVPEGVTVDTEGEDPVAVVSAARTEAEPESETTVDMEAIEVEQKGKGEDGEAEGAKE